MHYLLNFMLLFWISCHIFAVGYFDLPGASAATLKPFRFSILSDILSSDKVGRTSPCGSHLWDRYSKRCRRLICARPGYKIKNGICVPEWQYRSNYFIASKTNLYAYVLHKIIFHYPEATATTIQVNPVILEFYFFF